MKLFKNKVAVITGAGSGIGKALANKCASLGMHIVLVDINKSALSELKKEIKNIKGYKSAIFINSDVSLYKNLKKIAKITLLKYGKVHLLFNNAGVILDKKIWEYDEKDWEWILGVDLYGVIYGVKAFLPVMEKQKEEACIINTASLGGFISSPTVGAYKVAKHSVVALTEILFYELKLKNSNVHTFLLAPSWCNTAIRDCFKHRPKRLKNKKIQQKEEKNHLRDKEVRDLMLKGMDPKNLADITFNAIRNDRFYIFSNDIEMKERVSERMENILNIKNPQILNK